MLTAATNSNHRASQRVLEKPLGDTADPVEDSLVALRLPEDVRHRLHGELSGL